MTCHVGIRPCLLCGLASCMGLVGLGLLKERSDRIASNTEPGPSLYWQHANGRENKVPNYRHVWFAHDIVFGNGRDGRLGLFGDRFFRAGADWQRVCHLDYDDDGLTNGQELGDPCCLWTPSNTTPYFSLEAQREYRRWDITHPGRPDKNVSHDRVLNAQPADCSNGYDAVVYADKFKHFYFSRAKDPFERVPLVPIKVVSLVVLVILLTDWFAHRGLAADICPVLARNPNLSTRSSVLICFASFLYMDLTSGIIHLILDYAPHWLPGLGVLARGFQYHHADPTAIIRISWYTYVSHVHVLCPLVAALLLLSDASRIQRLFWFWGAMFVHLFQTTHRWAHFPPEELPTWIRVLQESRLLLSHERHMQHHEDLEQQFTILSGHTDVLLDAISRRLLPPWRYDLWVIVGIVWFLFPVVMDIALRGFFESLELVRSEECEADTAKRKHVELGVMDDVDHIEKGDQHGDELYLETAPILSSPATATLQATPANRRPAAAVLGAGTGC